jgi:hypothetical protein
MALDGVRVDAAGLTAAVAAKKPGDGVKIKLLRGGKELEVEAVLRNRLQRSFKIIPIETPTALQSSILHDWQRPR